MSTNPENYKLTIADHLWRQIKIFWKTRIVVLNAFLPQSILDSPWTVIVLWLCWVGVLPTGVPRQRLPVRAVPVGEVVVVGGVGDSCWPHGPPVAAAPPLALAGSQRRQTVQQLLAPAAAAIITVVFVYHVASCRHHCDLITIALRTAGGGTRGGAVSRSLTSAPGGLLRTL